MIDAPKTSTYDVRERLATYGIDTDVTGEDILFKIKIPRQHDWNKAGVVYYIYDARFKILHKNGVLAAEFKTHEQFYKFLNLS